MIPQAGLYDSTLSPLFTMQKINHYIRLCRKLRYYQCNENETEHTICTQIGLIGGRKRWARWSEL